MGMRPSLHQAAFPLGAMISTQSSRGCSSSTNGDDVWTSSCRSAEMRSAPQVSSAFWGRGPSSERKSGEEAVSAVIGSCSAEIAWPLVALLVSKPAVPTETPGGTDPWADSSTSLPKSIEVSDVVDACAA